MDYIKKLKKLGSFKGSPLKNKFDVSIQNSPTKIKTKRKKNRNQKKSSTPSPIVNKSSIRNSETSFSISNSGKKLPVISHTNSDKSPDPNCTKVVSSDTLNKDKNPKCSQVPCTPIIINGKDLSNIDIEQAKKKPKAYFNLKPSKLNLEDNNAEEEEYSFSKNAGSSCCQQVSPSNSLSGRRKNKRRSRNKRITFDRSQGQDLFENPDNYLSCEHSFETSSDSSFNVSTDELARLAEKSFEVFHLQRLKRSPSRNDEHRTNIKKNQNEGLTSSPKTSLEDVNDENNKSPKTNQSNKRKRNLDDEETNPSNDETTSDPLNSTKKSKHFRISLNDLDLEIPSFSIPKEDSESQHLNRSKSTNLSPKPCGLINQETPECCDLMNNDIDDLTPDSLEYSFNESNKYLPLDSGGSNVSTNCKGKGKETHKKSPLKQKIEGKMLDWKEISSPLSIVGNVESNIPDQLTNESLIKQKSPLSQQKLYNTESPSKVRSSPKVDSAYEKESPTVNSLLNAPTSNGNNDLKKNISQNLQASKESLIENESVNLVTKPDDEIVSKNNLLENETPTKKTGAQVINKTSPTKKKSKDLETLLDNESPTKKTTHIKQTCVDSPIKNNSFKVTHETSLNKNTSEDLETLLDNESPTKKTTHIKQTCVDSPIKNNSFKVTHETSLNKNTAKDLANECSDKSPAKQISCDNQANGSLRMKTRSPVKKESGHLEDIRHYTSPANKKPQGKPTNLDSSNELQIIPKTSPIKKKSEDSQNICTKETSNKKNCSQYLQTLHNQKSPSKQPISGRKMLHTDSKVMKDVVSVKDSLDQVINRFSPNSKIFVFTQNSVHQSDSDETILNENEQNSIGVANIETSDVNENSLEVDELNKEQPSSQKHLYVEGNCLGIETQENINVYQKDNFKRSSSDIFNASNLSLTVESEKSICFQEQVDNTVSFFVQTQDTSIDEIKEGNHSKLSGGRNRKVSIEKSSPNPTTEKPSKEKYKIDKTPQKFGIDLTGPSKLGEPFVTDVVAKCNVILSEEECDKSIENKVKEIAGKDVTSDLKLKKSKCKSAEEKSPVTPQKKSFTSLKDNVADSLKNSEHLSRASKVTKQKSIMEYLKVDENQGVMNHKKRKHLTNIPEEEPIFKKGKHKNKTENDLQCSDSPKENFDCNKNGENELQKIENETAFPTCTTKSCIPKKNTLKLKLGRKSSLSKPTSQFGIDLTGESKMGEVFKTNVGRKKNHLYFDDSDNSMVDLDLTTVHKLTSKDKIEDQQKSPAKAKLSGEKKINRTNKSEGQQIHSDLLTDTDDSYSEEKKKPKKCGEIVKKIESGEESPTEGIVRNNTNILRRSKKTKNKLTHDNTKKTNVSDLEFEDDENAQQILEPNPSNEKKVQNRRKGSENQDGEVSSGNDSIFSEASIEEDQVSDQDFEEHSNLQKMQQKSPNSQSKFQKRRKDSISRRKGSESEDEKSSLGNNSIFSEASVEEDQVSDQDFEEHTNLQKMHQKSPNSQSKIHKGRKDSNSQDEKSQSDDETKSLHRKIKTTQTVVDVLELSKKVRDSQFEENNEEKNNCRTERASDDKVKTHCLPKVGNKTDSASLNIPSDSSDYSDYVSELFEPETKDTTKHKRGDIKKSPAFKNDRDKILQNKSFSEEEKDYSYQSSTPESRKRKKKSYAEEFEKSSGEDSDEDNLESSRSRAGNKSKKKRVEKLTNREIDSTSEEEHTKQTRTKKKHSTNCTKKSASKSKTKENSKKESPRKKSTSNSHINLDNQEFEGEENHDPGCGNESNSTGESDVSQISNDLTKKKSRGNLVCSTPIQKNVCHDDWDSVVEELCQTVMLSEDDKQSLEELRIGIYWELPLLHQIDDGLQKTSFKKLEARLGLEKVNINTQRFTAAEEKIIKRNWEKFSKTYKFDNPELFMPSKSTTNLLKQETRLNFKRWLAKGLPDRRLYSVYRKFCDMYSVSSRGRWTPKEDKVLMKLYHSYDAEGVKQKLGITRIVFLKMALKRTEMSIHRRLQYLLLDNNEKKWLARDIEWCPKLEGQLVYLLLKFTSSDSVEDLRYGTISAQVWRKVADKMDLPCERLVNHWKFYLYTALFSERPVFRNELACELIKWFYNSDIEHWEEINWSKLSKKAGGMGSCFLHKFVKTLTNRVEGKDNFRDCIKHLFKHYLPKYEDDRGTRLFRRAKYNPTSRMVKDFVDIPEDMAPFVIK